LRVGTAPVAEEELYDEAGVIPAETAAADDDDSEEMYQDAGDTRTYRQAADLGICARALYDYQAGQFFSSFSQSVSATCSYYVGHFCCGSVSVPFVCLSVRFPFVNRIACSKSYGRILMIFWE